MRERKKIEFDGFFVITGTKQARTMKKKQAIDPRKKTRSSTL